MAKKIVIHQAVYYGLGILLMKSVSLIMLPILTQYFTPAEYGALELMLSISNFATLLVGFGLVDALYRFVGLNKNPEDEDGITANFITLAIIIGVISILIGMSLAPFILTLLTDEITLFDMQLLVLMFSLEGCIAIPLAWLRMKDQAFVFFILTSIKVIIQALLSWILLREGYGITAILWGGLISILLLVSVLLFMQIRQTGLRLDLVLSKNILTYGYPLVLSSFATFAMYGVDSWVIVAVSSEHELGLYSLAKKIAIISVILMQPYCMWWYARRFEQLKQPDGMFYVAKTTSLGLVLMMCFATLIYLSSSLLMQLFIDNKYHAALVYLPWLLVFLVVKQITDLINMGCYVNKSTVNVMYIDFATAALALILCYILSGPYQVFGVLYALIAAQIFRAITFYIFSQRVLPLKFAWYKLFLLAVICFSLILLMPYAHSIQLQIILVFFALSVLLAFLYCSGFISKDAFSGGDRVGIKANALS